MTQLEKSAHGTFLPGHGATRFGRYELVAVGLIVSIAILVFVGLAVVRIGSPNAEAAAPAGEVVDGWMTAIAGANGAARLEDAGRARDGWSPYLLASATEPIDGWSTYLLNAEVEITDGWAARYLVADD